MDFDIIIDWELYKTNFKGHEVEMKLRPLKRWASLLLTPIFMRITEFIKTDKKKKHKSEAELVTKDDIDFVYKVQEVAEKIFPVHVKDISGITINKQRIDIKTLCEESAFGPLCMDIVGELAKRSQLPELEVKNSNGPSIMPTSDGNTPVQ